MAPERTVLLASPDTGLRERLRSILAGMRWRVREANGGAEALGLMEQEPAEALLLDAWLPDLEAGAVAEMLVQMYPKLDLIRWDGSTGVGVHRSPRRQELLQALRESCATDGPIRPEHSHELQNPTNSVDVTRGEVSTGTPKDNTYLAVQEDSFKREPRGFAEIPGLVGQSEAMRELSRLIRLVAPHTARVLIEGETGTGKELVAKALHSMSTRVKKAFVVLNCAAIPEALLEAELFGHTRGAFTGALQARIGRIEVAHGGTLFLDEIGEMPVPLQAKLLRFLENGELQRVGDNETVRVDVRVISATHKNLDQCVKDGSFRLDLLHRLAVFPIDVPNLRDRLDDLELLAEHFLVQLSREMPRKRLSRDACEALRAHVWPGNVRELGHVLQRAAILAGSNSEITAAEIRVRRSER